jgi:hypothetical protein
MLSRLGRNSPGLLDVALAAVQSGQFNLYFVQIVRDEAPKPWLGTAVNLPAPQQ